MAAVTGHDSCSPAAVTGSPIITIHAMAPSSTVASAKSWVPTHLPPGIVGGEQPPRWRVIRGTKRPYRSGVASPATHGLALVPTSRVDLGPHQPRSPRQPSHCRIKRRSGNRRSRSGLDAGQIVYDIVAKLSCSTRRDGWPATCRSTRPCLPGRDHCGPSAPLTRTGLEKRRRGAPERALCSPR